MMKTPEEMAEEYADESPWHLIRDSWTIARDAYFAGYQAAKDETNLPTPAKWISVNERLPEVEQSSFAMRRESTCVLIVSNGNVHVAHLCEKWCDRTQLIFEACDCDCRGHDMEQEDWELDQVSHWMPLPKPPREEK